MEYSLIRDCPSSQFQLASMLRRKSSPDIWMEICVSTAPNQKYTYKSHCFPCMRGRDSFSIVRQYNWQFDKSLSSQQCIGKLAVHSFDFQQYIAKLRSFPTKCILESWRFIFLIPNNVFESWQFFFWIPYLAIHILIPNNILQIGIHFLNSQQ